MNVRIIAFALVALTLIGYPAYIFLDEKVSGGVKARDGYLEVNLKAMSTFEFDQSTGQLSDVPEKWRSLDGKRVVVEGEMWQPVTAEDRIKEFELVYSIAKCCFSGPPKIQHFVLGRVPEGRMVNYYQGLVRVTGTLRVKIETAEGKVTRVYSMDVEKVEPV